MSAGPVSGARRWSSSWLHAPAGRCAPCPAELAVAHMCNGTGSGANYGGGAGPSVLALDYLVLAVFFVTVLVVGLWSSYRPATDRATVRGYFLAGADAPWYTVGASLFASNVGAAHYVGLPAAAALGGVAVSGFELHAAFVLLALGWLFAPVYYASGVHTTPEYVLRRFGSRWLHALIACCMLLYCVLCKISVELYAGAVMLEQAFQLPLYPSVGVILFIAGVFTVAGGMTPVLVTDFAQVIVMLLGGGLLTILSFAEVGGLSSLRQRYAAAEAAPPAWNVSECAASGLRPRPDAFNLMRPAGDTADLPWTGMTFGLTVSAVWHWCADMVIVQRVLAARSSLHAKVGCVFAGFLKLLPMWMFVLPGMIARVLYTDCLICYDAADCLDKCGVASGCSNNAYPMLVNNLLPQGAVGAMLACMLSALLSSLTSIFNSSGAIFALDVWPLLCPCAGDREKRAAGRLFVALLVALAVLWIPVMRPWGGRRLFDYVQGVTSCLAPPMCALYVMGVFAPWANAPPRPSASSSWALRTARVCFATFATY